MAEFTREYLQELVLALENYGISISAKRLRGTATHSIPIGTVIDWPYATLPDSERWGFWLWADGSAIPAEFQELRDIAGPNTPNLRGRVRVGRLPGDPDFGTLGQTGGLKEVTLSGLQIPEHHHVGGEHAHGLNNHTHEGVMGVGAAPDVGLALDGFSSVGFKTVATSGPTPANTSAGGQVDTSSFGSGEAHQNLPPYIVVNVIVKAA
jgi:microcystin-dependent protein